MKPVTTIPKDEIAVAADTITIEPILKTDRGQIVQLYKAAGWWQPADDGEPDFVDHIATNSYCFVGAFQGECMIGMGRALSDGVSDAYIQDVTVLPAYRGRGIGARIIARLIRKLRADKIGWIGLIGEPGTETFYKRLGFTEMQDAVPFIYKG